MTDAHGVVLAVGVVEDVDVVAPVAKALCATAILAIGTVAGEELPGNLSGQEAEITDDVTVELADLIVVICSISAHGPQRRGRRGKQDRIEFGVKDLGLPSSNVPHKCRCAIQPYEPLLERRRQLRVPSGGREATEATPGVIARRNMRQCASAMSADVEAIA